uniref:Translation initiation factor IF-2-like n=1 Tax=Tursiops truncatus TaxID=9739 RepID=A0A6J3S6T6_TURTR|nr:translation initiation factor IF-2-like [Tursiops truncatus]
MAVTLKAYPLVQGGYEFHKAELLLYVVAKLTPVPPPHFPSPPHYQMYQEGGPETPGGAGGCGGGVPGAGVAVRAPSRAPAGGVRPRGVPCAECLRPCARPCGAVERWPGRSWPGLAAPEPATRPPGGTGSRGPRRAVPARPAATRAHAHAAAGLGRLGGRAGGGPRSGRAGAEGAPLSGAGRLPAAAAGDRTQLATSGWAAAGRRGGGTERAGTPHSRTDLEGVGIEALRMVDSAEKRSVIVFPEQPKALEVERCRGHRGTHPPQH